MEGDTGWVRQVKELKTLQNGWTDSPVEKNLVVLNGRGGAKPPVYDSESNVYS